MKKESIPMKAVIFISFISIMAITFGAIIFIEYVNWKASKDEMIKELEQQTDAEINSRMEAFISLPEEINNENYHLIKNKIIDIHNKEEREIYFAGVIKASSEEVYSFSYGTEAGEYFGARRNPDNEIEVMENTTATDGHTRYYSINKDMTANQLAEETGLFDARTRDWYIIAKEKKKPSFSPIYKHFVMNDLAVSAAYPIYDSNGKLEGVLGTHIILTNINRYLADIVRSKKAEAYIIEKNTGDLVANSQEISNFTTLAGNKIKRTGIEEIDNQAVIDAYHNYMKQSVQSHVAKLPEDKLHIMISEYRAEGLDWLIITSLPENQFIAGLLKSFRISLFLSVLALLIAVLLYKVSADRVFKPIEDLVRTTEEFTGGDFSKRVRIKREDEIGKLSHAYNLMAEHIQDLILNLERKVSARTMELEAANIQLRNSEENIRLLLDSTAEAIYGLDMDGNCTLCNQSCLNMLMYKQEELIGKNMHWLIHSKNAEGAPIPIEECNINRALTNGEYVHAENEVYYRSDGTFFPVEYFSYPQYREGVLVGAVVTFMDITDRKKSQEKILDLSYHDQLTGLFNRRYFDEELKRIDVEANLPITIIMADMNGLKLINDSFGHIAGDQALIRTAKILAGEFREADRIARYGGDEFVILLPKTDKTKAERIVNRIYGTVLQEKISSVSISVSIGYDTKSKAEENIFEIYKKAEDRMYRQKLVMSPQFKRNLVEAIMNEVHEKSESEAEHSNRVSELCEQTGRALKMADRELSILKNAAYLHDIGKITVDAKILNKQGRLTDLEWEEIKHHSEVGYRILSTVNGMAEIAEYVLSHHERWDGTGYPKGTKGTDIPLISRMIAITEAYEAMTSGRCYKSAITKEAAIVELRSNAGTQLDPELTELFIEKVLK